MKKSSVVALDIFIVVILIAAAAGGSGTYYFYSQSKSVKTDLAKAEAGIRTAQSAQTVMEAELDDVKAQLRNIKDGSGTQLTKHPLTGKRPVEIVKLALTLKGEDVTKFAVEEKSNNDAKAVVWVGPKNSEFGMAYHFAKQSGEWVLYDIKSLGN